MVGEVFAGIGAFKAMLDIAKTLIGVSQSTAVNAAVIDLQATILTAQTEYSAMMNKVGALEAELARLKAWGTEKEKYELKVLGTGAPVYMLKPEVRGAEPPHWICPNCYVQSVKGFLQPTGQMAGRHRMYNCSRCKSDIGCDSTAVWLD